MTVDSGSAVAFTAIPIIDVSPFTTPEGYATPAELDAAKRRIAAELHTACKDVGFFYVKGHNVPHELVTGSQHLAREFFSLPTEEKQKIAITNSKQRPACRGYQRLGQNVTQYQKDWHEAIDCYKHFDENAPEVVANKPLHGPNQWPENPPAFRDTFERYVESMKALGSAIMRAMALGLGLDENFFVRDFIGDSFWVMRIIGYPPLSEGRASDSGVGVSCGEHTDYGCLTIINQDSTKGALQVKNTAGQWISADPIPGCFVMNIGDMVRVWTNGLYQSTPHQVINKGDSFRVSIPFFFEPNFEAMIEPLECCTTALGIEPKYPRVRYGDHLIGKVSNNFEFDNKM
eukprot:Opistho-2@28843